MNINGLSSSSTQTLSDISSIVSSATSDASQSSSTTASSDSSAMSGPAKMLSKLKELEAKDPAKFKEVMATISSKLKDAADAATDPGEKKALTDLSTKFATAGQSGDLSSLTPSGKGGHAHGPRSGGGARHGDGDGDGGAKGASSSSSSSSSSSTDPADTNGDGVVSAAEQQAYDASQAVKGASSSAAQAYTKSGGEDKGRELMSKVSSIVDSVLSGLSG